jgi:hypothetical protein
MVDVLRRLSDFLYWVEGGVDWLAGRLILISNDMVERERVAAHRDGSDNGS